MSRPVSARVLIGADPNRDHYAADDPDDMSTPFYYAAGDFGFAERGSLEEQKLERIYMKDAGAVHNWSD